MSTPSGSNLRIAASACALFALVRRNGIRRPATFFAMDVTEAAPAKPYKDIFVGDGEMA